MKTIHPDIEQQIKRINNTLNAGETETALQYAIQACHEATLRKDTLGYDVARLYVAIANTGLGRYTTAISIYHEVWDNLERSTDDDTIFQMYYTCILCYQSIGDWENSFLYSYKGMKRAQQKNNEQAIIQLSYSLALTFERLGQISKALPYVETAIELSRKKGDKEFLPKALSLYAKILSHTLKNHEKAREYYHEILDIASTTNNYFLQSVALTNLASLHPEQLSDSVAALYQQAVEAARKSTIPFAITSTLGKASEWYLSNQNLTIANQLFREILRWAQKSADDLSGFWLGNFYLARVYLQSKDYTASRKYADAALRFLPRDAYAIEHRNTLDLHYRIERESSNEEKALQWLEKVHELDREIATQKQEEAAKTAFIVARIEKIIAQLEEERRHIKEIQATIDQQNAALLSATLELEQKKQALQKIKRIATDTLKPKSNKTEPLAKATTPKELGDFLRNLNTDEHSWQRFKDHLEHLHPHFISRLMERCSELSPMQIRICCLLRLQLSSKEIATMLNLSKRTVDNHREHIRIKLNIPRSVNLVAHILNI